MGNHLLPWVIRREIVESNVQRHKFRRHLPLLIITHFYIHQRDSVQNCLLRNCNSHPGVNL